MANTTIYIIDTTDTSDSFAIQPRTFDGSGGVQQHTDLTLYGNAAPNWGEKFNENFYKLIEHFAVHQQEPGDPDYSSSTPRPKNQDSFVDSSLPDAGSAMPTGSGINQAIEGQGWFNKTDGKLYVCTKAGQSGVAEWKAIGASSSQPPSPTIGDLWYDAANSELKVYDGTSFVSTAGNYVLKTGDTMDVNADLTFNGGEVLGLPATPSVSSAAASKQYVDSVAGASGAVLKTGDTMTGYLTLNADPLNPLHASTKQYVDTSILGVASDYVNVTGDTMTGTLTINGGLAGNFVGVEIVSDGGPVIDMKSTNNVLNGSIPPAIVMYNPDNDPAVTGSPHTHGYLRISNRDSTFLNIEADKDDLGADTGPNTLNVLTLAQNGTMTYNGNGTIGDITLPNATIPTDNSVPTKKYVDDAVTAGVAGIGGLVDVITLQYTNSFVVNSSTDTLVSGFQIDYTAPAGGPYQYVIRASLNVFHNAASRQTYWSLKEGGTNIVDIKTSEGLNTYTVASNVFLMGSGTLTGGNSYTFNIWAKNSNIANIQNVRLNANEDYPTGGDPNAPQSTLELMVFG